jgi:hypothetical protein
MTDTTQLLTEAARLLQRLEDLTTTADILGDVVGFYRYRDALYQARLRYARRHLRYVQERNAA